MTVVALSLMGTAAVLVLILGWRKAPDPLTASLAAVSLAAAAVVAAYTEDARGFALAACAAVSVLAAAVGGMKIAPLAFYFARRQGTAPGSSPDPAQPNLPQPSLPQPLQGGLMIGLLERTAISVAILTGWPEGIAIVLAVKGLARYPELREAHASEQFIIGTFASVLWAIACGAIGRGMFT